MLFLNAPMVESADHKVVIVLDRSPKFGARIPAADVSFTLRDDQNAPITGELCKILWNCSIEAITEFHRVVIDLFPQGQKQLRFVTSDFVAKFLTDAWSDKLIGKQELIDVLKECKPPEAGDSSSCSILLGILYALQAIAQRSPLQQTAFSEYRANLERCQTHQPAEKRRLFRPNVADLVWNHKPAAMTASSTSGYNAQQKHLAMQKSPCMESTCSNEEGEIREGGETMEMEQEVKKMAERATSGKAEPMGQSSWKKENNNGTNMASNFHLQNRGTIVVVTSLESMSDYDAINEYLAEQIVASNQTSRNSGDDKLARIDSVDLYVLNIAPDPNSPAALLFGAKKRQAFNSRLVTVAVGQNLIPGVHKILHEIYGLISTTVVGIPMKEETQLDKGQSVNYDVEMLHPRRAHLALTASGMLDPGGPSKLLDSALTHGGMFSSVRLKWCTATNKLKSEMFPVLQETFTMTPAQVHNRASVCLTTFLQNGKNVMLEVPPEAYQTAKPPLQPNLQNKLISHYMSQEVSTGQLILHCVAIGERATLGDKLKSDCVYGAEKSSAEIAAQLNLKAMTQLVHAAQIKPVPIPLERQQIVERARGRLIRLEINEVVDQQEGNTENGEEEGEEFGDAGDKDYGEQFDHMAALMAQDMPFRLRDTFIYNIPEKFEPIISLIHHQVLDEASFEKCRAAIHMLVTGRDGKEALTDKRFECTLFQSGSTATATKDEQYRVAFDELCRLFQQYAFLSPVHRRLLDIFVEASGVRPKQHGIAGTHSRNHHLKRTAHHERNAAADRKRAAPSKLDEEQQMNERILRRKAQVTALWKPGEEIDLYDWWLKRYEGEYWSKWKGDFEGRKKYGDKAQEHLYPNLKLPQGQSKAAGTGSAGPIE